MSKGKVLVVDDDLIVLEATRERLQRAGYDVETRDEAIGTTEYIAKHQPDVVLLDVMMPGLSGDRLAQLLKKQPRTRDVPIILHTSKSAGELEALVQQSEAIGAIEKTNDDDQFMLEFQRLVSRARLRKSQG
ncbi:MAG: response regulator [Myxococcota bacterium]